MALPDTSNCVANFSIKVNYAYFSIDQDFQWSPRAFAKRVRQEIKCFDQETIFNVEFDGVNNTTNCFEEALLALETLVDKEKGI